MGTPYSGLLVAVAGQPCVAEVEFEHDAEAAEVSASNMQGGVFAPQANEDVRGWYRGYGHTPIAARFPGETVDLLTTDLSGGSSKGAVGPAIIDYMELRWEQQDAAPIGFRIGFGANGAWTFGAAVAADADPTPTFFTPLERKLLLTDSEVLNIEKMRLLMYRRNKRYANSSTAGWFKRNKGNLHGLMEVEVDAEDPSLLPIVNNTYVAKFYVTATLYWEIAYFRITAIKPLKGSTESPENVKAKIIGKFTAWDGTSIGYVKTPALAPVTLWPE